MAIGPSSQNHCEGCAFAQIKPNLGDSLERQMVQVCARLLLGDRGHDLRQYPEEMTDIDRRRHDAAATCAERIVADQCEDYGINTKRIDVLQPKLKPAPPLY